MPDETPIDKAVNEAMALDEMFEAIAKTRRLEYLGHLNDVSLALRDARAARGIHEGQFRHALDKAKGK